MSETLPAKKSEPRKLGAEMPSGLDAPKTSDAISRVVDLVSVVKNALKSEWNTATSLPPLLTAALQDITPVIDGIPDIKSEFKLGAPFYKAVATGLVDLAFLFIAVKTVQAAAHAVENEQAKQTYPPHA